MAQHTWNMNLEELREELRLVHLRFASEMIRKDRLAFRLHREEIRLRGAEREIEQLKREMAELREAAQTVDDDHQARWDAGEDMPSWPPFVALRASLQRTKEAA